MAENQSGRSWIRRAGSEFIDRAFLGNRGHDFKSGYWDATGAKQGGLVGIAGMLNPLAGLLASKGVDAYNRSHAGYQGPQFSGVLQNQPTTSGLPNTETSYGVSLPNYGGTPTGMMDVSPGGQGAPGSLAGMIAGGNRQGPSGYGPYQGGYQLGQQPTTSGLPNTQTSYGVSLPNYGGPTGPANYGGGQAQGPLLTPQQQAEADRMAKNNRYGGPSTFASPNNRQSGGDSNVMNTGGRYSN